MRSNKNQKIITSIVLLIISLFAEEEILKYYYNVGYFFYIVLSFGILLIMYAMPLSVFLFPFIHIEEMPWTKFKLFCLNITTSVTYTWSVLLFMSDGKIFNGQSGGSYLYYDGNELLRNLGALSLLFIATYMFLNVLFKYCENKKITSEGKNKVELYEKIL
ncbi:hypothetical protein [Floricoccus tropicus]|uniref:hypothetical protein n=1 Tax=Floricoccus tropicus TaxID=1859473 RepID=UPI0011814075|nr:hypothetical protein [Floricoccus tropicus]